MKKLFLVLGVCGFMFACKGTSDCDCTASALGETLPVSTASPSIAEFDGDCKDVAWTNLPAAVQTAWEGINATLKCVDH